MSPTAQYQTLTELQGRLVSHRKRDPEKSDFDTQLMRPRRIKVDGHTVLTWSVGRELSDRVAPKYDAGKDELEWTYVEGAGVCYSDFAAIPDLGVLAVDDRHSENHLGGKAAIARLRSVFDLIDDAEINILLTTTAKDAKRAIDNWNLTQFSFVARPYNPHPVGDLSKELSDKLKSDGIFRYRAVAEPMPGHKLTPQDDGHIAAAVELSDAGYGQYGIKGYTPDGHEGQIKRPKFEVDKEKNEKNLENPRELRVIVDTEDESDKAMFERVARALIGFYGSD